MYPSLNDLLRKVSMQIVDHEIQEKHINFSCLTLTVPVTTIDALRHFETG